MSMKHELDLVKAFHTKFQAGVSESPCLIPPDRSQLRYRLMKEEVDEYIEEVQGEDIQNIAKELADILYTVYGTIVEHGLQDRIEDVFSEVHRSNMTKDYHEEKMVKGDSYVPPDIQQYIEGI